MRRQVLSILLIGLASGAASADVITEYTSSATWDGAVTNVSTFTIPQATVEIYGQGEVPSTYEYFYPSLTVGPGTFTTPYMSEGTLYSDGGYGTNVNYVSAAPQAIFGTLANVVESFNASSDITALLFEVGTYYEQATLDVSVNGQSLAPLSFAAGFGEQILGVTDSNPITEISFTTLNAQYAVGGGSTLGEMDVIGQYQTATLSVPEIPSSLAFLLGGIAMLFLVARRLSISNGAPIAPHMLSARG